MKAAYVYDSSDSQGPWILKCERCIDADREVIHAAPPEKFSLGGEWAHDDEDTDWRCACCGYTPA